MGYAVVSILLRGRYEITCTFLSISLRPLMPFMNLKKSKLFLYDG
jgi:hypothetical protein